MAYKLTLGALAGVATILLLASQHFELSLSRTWLVTLVVVVTIVRFVEPPTSYLIKKRHARSEARLARGAELAIKGLWLALHEERGDALDLSITCFSLSRRTLFRAHRPIAGFGLRHRLEPTIRWSKGKGIPGYVWARRRPVYVAHRESGNSGGQGASVATLEDINASDRERDQLRFNAVATYAAPIIVSTGEYLGCLMVEFNDTDRPPSVRDQALVHQACVTAAALMIK